MPRQGQIIPSYLVPHVQTYINDNTTFTDTALSFPSNGTRLLCVFRSAKGEDHVLKTITNLADYIEEFGKPNSAYGQPCYMPYAALNSGNAKCLCMRIMPNNATYSTLVILARTKVTGTNLEVKFETRSLTDFNDPDSLQAAVDALRVTTATDDAEDPYNGYATYPIIGIRCKGRGIYGNALRVRFTTDLITDTENHYKNYIVEVFENDGGLIKKETWGGVSLNENAVISNESIFVDDVMNDENGSNKIETYVSNTSLNAIYNLYTPLVTGEDETVVPFNEFDFLSGLVKNESTAINHYSLITDSAQNSISLSKTDGVPLSGGTDGTFSGTAPVAGETVADEASMLALTGKTNGYIVKFPVEGSDVYYRLIDSSEIGSIGGWTKIYDSDINTTINSEYIAAFKGENGYDKAVLSKKRAPAELILDANYDMPVKIELANLALTRGDARCILDCGVRTSIETLSSYLNNQDNAYLTTVNNRIISKECQHYKIRDPFNNRLVTVTSTYFIASYLPSHYVVFGNHIPFVGEAYAQLTGHAHHSLKPVIDADDLATKDSLYRKRFNFFECIGEDNFVRAVQGTSQTTWSDLSEENNVAVMLEMKRTLEDFVSARLYNFAEAEDRKALTEDANALFTDFINVKLRSYDVYFDMNAFEEERSIIHCYLAIVFKTMAKRAIIEIDINKRV